MATKPTKTCMHEFSKRAIQAYEKRKNRSEFDEKELGNGINAIIASLKLCKISAVDVGAINETTEALRVQIEAAELSSGDRALACAGLGRAEQILIENCLDHS